jgi:ribosomal protein S18 acetylase RimI-like enzyme
MVRNARSSLLQSGPVKLRDPDWWTERMDPMIYYELASKKHFDELLEIIYYQDNLTSQPLLDHVQLTSDQFGRCLRTTGQVYRILSGNKLAGLCWIEHRGSILYLHGLILRSSYQGKGIGTKTLHWLDKLFRGTAEAIELRVHSSNHRAIKLYEHCGYTASESPDPCGFISLRKKLRKCVFLPTDRVTPL